MLFCCGYLTEVTWCNLERLFSKLYSSSQENCKTVLLSCTHVLSKWCLWMKSVWREGEKRNMNFEIVTVLQWKTDLLNGFSKIILNNWWYWIMTYISQATSWLAVKWKTVCLLYYYENYCSNYYCYSYYYCWFLIKWKQSCHLCGLFQIWIYTCWLIFIWQ